MLIKRQCSEIALRNNPDMKIIGGVEYEDVFGFNMVPKDKSESNGFANGCLYVVNKNSGKSEWITSYEIMQNWGWPPLGIF